MTELAFILEHQSKNLAAVALLLSKHPELNKDFVLNQINGIQKAKQKLPELSEITNFLFPSKLSLEQCSSEETAKFKSKIIAGQSIVDLTGGFGIDSYYLSKQFSSLTYVEPDKELFDIVKSNFSTLKANNISMVNSSAEEFIESTTTSFDIVYIDPSRRKENQRVFQLQDCVPNIIELQENIFKFSNQLLIKAAPLLDIKQSIQDLKNVSKVIILSVNNDCKEVLYLIRKEWIGEPEIEAINLGKNEQFFSFNYSNESEVHLDYSDALDYLYEPNSSILKSGGFNSIAESFKLDKIAPNTHLYTSDELISDFPGRIFKVEEVLSYQPKAFKKLGINKANVSCRNFKDSVEQMKKKLNLKDGGDYYLLGYTNNESKQQLCLCSKT